jgi:hypothetical protein
MRFNPQNWLYETDLTGGATVISSAEELIELSRAINEGDHSLASGTIRLEEDIDLGGKEWEPIGNDLSRAFKGTFDGCGHTIKNFVIKSKQTKAKGFFGYLKGEVYNLTVECRIRDKHRGIAGGIAAFCEEGVIGCCAAVANIRCGRGGRYGGLVGANTGRIFHSYSAGKITSVKIPWYWLLPLLPLLLLLLLFLFPRAGTNADSLPVFAPVPQDIGIIAIPGAAEPQVTDGNFVSFQFENKIDVNTTTGECLLNFMNPGTSNHDMVVQLQITDAQAISIMGSTGRSDEEQQKLEANPKYDPENYRTILAESGAIPPGFQLQNLTLIEQPNGATLPPGEHSAIVYLIFYNMETHNRAMVESQLPVVISVHE